MSKEAIQALTSIIRNPGGGTWEMKEEAVRQLGTYVPDPEAVKVLTSIIEGAGGGTWEMKLLAIKSLGKNP